MPLYKISKSTKEERQMMKILKHNLGLCVKAKMGYRCYGGRNYEECGK